ncbi:MAG: MazG nucleotide pyrophosphohydrolase domain-containing protein [Bacteroidota bacterium]
MSDLSLPPLPASPATLAQLQQYQDEMCKARGWDKASTLETFLLFSEEFGELAKAIRNRLALYQEKDKTLKSEELEGEFADVLSYLMELANHFDIDLETVYRTKEEINAKRSWN